MRCVRIHTNLHTYIKKSRRLMTQREHIHIENLQSSVPALWAAHTHLATLNLRQSV